MSPKQLPPDSHDESAAVPASQTQALQHDSERFRLLVENSRDLIVEVSPSGEALYVSPNIRTVLGFAPDEIIGRSPFSRVHPDDLPHVQEQFAVPGGRAIGRHQHRDGSWRWMETSGRTFAPPHDRNRRVLIARDITAQKEAENESDRLRGELARMEKLTALGTLAGGIAHDFNNLLTGVAAYVDIARSQTRQPEVLGSLTQITKVTDRAKHLTDQILAFSRQHQHERLPVELAPIVLDALKLIQATLPHDIEVQTDLSEDAGLAIVDPTQIYQVVINLCANALHAMRHSPGKLIVRLAPVEIDGASPFFRDGLRPGRFVCLAVSDTGHGMDAITQQRIFEPFFTTKAPGEGTGLGLAIVQRIVRDHDAFLHLRSQPGGGTTFRIFFPLAARAPATSSASAPRGQGERILFVDDEPTVGIAFRNIVETSNYSVSAHSNPWQAIADFRAHPHDLVVVDLAMPELSGIDFALRVLESAPCTPVLLTSDDFGTWTPEQMNARGICGILAKPFSADAMLHSIHASLAQRSRANSSRG